MNKKVFLMAAVIGAGVLGKFWLGAETKTDEKKEAPKFESSISVITPDINEKMGNSWNEKLSPVQLNDLRYVTVSHWDFFDKVLTGELIVHERVAKEVVDIFKELYEAKFPIQSMKLISKFDSILQKSISENNSYAHHTRDLPNPKKPGARSLSNHAFGLAIDINPQQNPYIEARGENEKEMILKIIPMSLDVLDRKNNKKGLILKDDPVYNAFKKRGWKWGGEIFDYCLILYYFVKILPGTNKIYN